MIVRTNHIDALAMSSDGSQIVSGGRDNLVKFWQSSDGKHLHTFSGHTAEIEGVAFISNDRQIASVSDDNSLKIWDARSASQLILDALF
ncbi:MAG: hypothetical protein AAF732_14765 [Pseudomonadota bacterium]